MHKGRVPKTVNKSDSNLYDLNKVRSELRLILKTALNDEFPNKTDLEVLYKSKGREIFVLAHVADIVRERQVGNDITYVVNLNINFTNICVKNCLFCAYSVPNKSTEGFLRYSSEYFEETIAKTFPYQITEVCVQGGIHPSLDFEIYNEIITNLRKVAPKIHIHAFSPQEIMNAATKSNLEVEEVLKELKKSGLDSIPGTAAEILNDDIRRIICPNKISTKEWTEIITIAHQTSIPTTATILFGHIENWEHWVEHLSILKQLQEQTKGFSEFIPLPFIAEKTKLKKQFEEQIQSLNSLDYLKFYSIARLYLGESFHNIQTSWVKLGIPLAQLTLNAGCNDFGGTLFLENITRSAGGLFGERQTPEMIQAHIQQLSRPFRERKTLYD